MPSKPLAAKASVFNICLLLHDAFQASSRWAAKSSAFKLPKQPWTWTVFKGNFVYDIASTVATETDFTEDGFYNDFFKMLGYFYGDIVGFDIVGFYLAGCRFFRCPSGITGGSI